MALRDDLLPVFQGLRGLMDDFGFRLFDVSLRTVTWSGAAVGDGAPTIVDTPLTLDGTHRIKVRKLTSREVVASGGFYQDGDFKIGPLTPAFAGGGVDPSLFNPPATGAPTEIKFRLVGPGVASWAKLVDTDTDGTFSYFFTVRLTNESSP